MNEFNDTENLLQERLARLEAGETLAAVSEGLPEETAAALKIAATLRQTALPEPKEAVVRQQRTAVLQAAQQQALATSPAAADPGEGWLAWLRRWWQANQALGWGAAALAAILLLILAGSLLNRPAPASVADGEPAQSAQASETAVDALVDQVFAPEREAPVEADQPAADTQAEVPVVEPDVALAPGESAGFQTFLPILERPLQTSPRTAVLGNLKGMVEVQLDDGRWQAVSHLSSLAAGSRVRTGAFSGATITFFDGSLAKIGPDSELSIDSLNARRPEDGFRTVILTQWRGESEHDVEFRNDAGSRYEVKSPSGTGIARGTTFTVLVLADLTSRYLVSEGRVDVTAVNITVAVLAGQLSTILAEAPPAAPVFQVYGEGEVTAVGDSWTIGGQIFATSEQTVMVGNPQVGDWVTVQGHLLPDGTKVADLIVLVHEQPQNLFSLTAVVTEMSSEQWLLGDLVILLDENTAVDPAIEIDEWVRVTGVIQADGSLLARRIQRLDSDSERAPFEFTGVVQTIGAEAWIISGVSVAIDGHTEIKGDPTVGDVVKVEGFIDAEGTWLAREIKVEDDDDVAEFEFIGLVDTIGPWVVAGIDLTTDLWTEIDEAIEPGDLVKVEGVILPNGTWLAEEIELLDDVEPEAIIIRFTGVVESLDPLLVSGWTLTVVDPFQISEAIAVGSLVQVTAQLAEDGTWELLSIRPLLPTTAGCFTVHSRILTVNGRQITLASWPTLVLDDDVQVDGTLVPNSIIAVYICLGEDDTLTVINIVVIRIIINIFPPGEVNHQEDDQDEGGQVTICHVPSGNPDNRHTITVSRSAWENAHSRHGDTLGPCGQGDDDDDDDDD